MEPANYQYQSAFARRYFAKGEARGEAKLILKLLTRRFGPLAPDALARVENASVDDLDRFAERLLTAASVDEVLR